MHKGPPTRAVNKDACGLQSEYIVQAYLCTIIQILTGSSANIHSHSSYAINEEINQSIHLLSAEMAASMWQAGIIIKNTKN